MKVKRLRRYRAPSYPTADELRERPELLELQPSRWIGTSAASVAALALGGASSCGSTTAQETAVEPPPVAAEQDAGSETVTEFEAGRPASDAGVAAADGGGESAGGDAASSGAASAGVMVFEAGRGRASVGCVVVAPPVFLTEQEAWEVITDEMASSGLNLAHGVGRVPGLTVPSHRVHQPVDLELDGSDSARQVGVEFVSGDDLHELERIGISQNPGGPILHSSVQSYAFLETAREMAQELGTPQSLVLGLFYDPATCYCMGSYCNPDWECQRSESSARRKSVADLRRQVQQFVEFLRASGVV